jgi:hypothetical protein
MIQSGAREVESTGLNSTGAGAFNGVCGGLERKSKGGLREVEKVWVVEDERVERNASLCMGIVGQGGASHLKWRESEEGERHERNSR